MEKAIFSLRVVTVPLLTTLFSSYLAILYDRLEAELFPRSVLQFVSLPAKKKREWLAPEHFTGNDGTWL